MSSTGNLSNTTTRIIVGVVGIPVVIFIVLQGGWVFFLFVQIIAVLALKELYDLAAHKSIISVRSVGYITSVALGVYVFLESRITPDVGVFLLDAIVTLFVLLVLTVELWRNKPEPLVNAATTVLSVLYIGLFMNALVGLRMLFVQPHIAQMLTQKLGVTEASINVAQQADIWGATLVLCVFVGIWVCDSAAFFTGKAFGSHKLFPRVSPNKSWEGAVVGFLASAAAFAGLASAFMPFLPMMHAVVLGALIGIVGQIGDLVESLFKRDAGIKDSSNIIPGHGGIFDRFDSILFAAPVAYLYVKAVILFG